MAVTTPLALDNRFFLEQDFGIVNPRSVDIALFEHLPLTAVPIGEEWFDCDAALLPQLIGLRDAADAVRLELFDLAQQHLAATGDPLFCALIETDESSEALAKRAGKNLLLQGNAETNYFLRYFDPRVFRHLQWILLPEQLQSLLMPAKIWTWFDPLISGWLAVDVKRSGQPIARTKPLGNFVPRLTGQQIAQLSRVELINKVLKRLSESGSADVSAATSRRIDKHLEQALEHERLTEENAQIQFALNALRISA